MTLNRRTSPGRMGAIIGLIVAVALFRVLRATLLPGLPNFSPLMATAFCGGLFLPGVLAWILPFAAMVVSDFALSLALGYPVLDSGQVAGWMCLLAAIGAGRWAARRERLGLGAFAALLFANALFFHLVTNAVCWAMEPAYPRGLGGLVQALTMGLPNLPPAWTFFRNSLASDFLFAGLILAVRYAVHRPSTNPVAA
jgi:hypothetical protein